MNIVIYRLTIKVKICLRNLMRKRLELLALSLLSDLVLACTKVIESLINT